jgi:16S rRNA processing protein RimM
VTDLNWDDMITVGRIVRPQGNKGEVVVAPETDFAAERFGAGASIWRLESGEPLRMAVTSGRPHDGRWVVGLAGIASIDAAETLRGSELRVPASSRKALGPREYYVHELAACRVETADGREIGRVDRVELGPGTPVLVVTGKRGELLVPLAEDICRRIDPAAGLIVIDPPEGLLELNEGGSGQVR